MTLLINDVRVVDDNRVVVEKVSFSVEPGKVTAILGANGAGKSELVLGVAGMLTVSSGTVTVDNNDITNKPPDVVRAAGVAVVPEGHRVLTRLTVDENLRAAGALAQTALPSNLARTYNTFPELQALKNQLAGSLSGGQQQMVALGHALMCQPAYLLIDEMSLGLAPLIVKRLMGVVAQLKEAGTGIVLIEQFAELALSISEQAIVLRNGELRYSGTASALIKDRTVLDEAYLGADG